MTQMEVEKRMAAQTGRANSNMNASTLQRFNRISQVKPPFAVLRSRDRLEAG
jgi:hypothetical protein